MQCRSERLGGKIRHYHRTHESDPGFNVAESPGVEGASGARGVVETDQSKVHDWPDVSGSFRNVTESGKKPTVRVNSPDPAGHVRT